jgi:hypothetical protein
MHLRGRCPPFERRSPNALKWPARSSIGRCCSMANSAVTEGLRTGEHRTLYADVPLSAIVGLFHKSFAPEAMTWRALLEGLHGQGWGPDTLAYFESEIGDAHFPAPSAAYPLILRAYGGAVVGVNGMHRLTAAVCWMAARDGAGAALKKVELQYCGIKPAAVSAMHDAARRGQRIDAAHTVHYETVLLRAYSPDAPRFSRGARYWRVKGDSVSPTPAPGGWLDTWRRRAGYRPRAEAGLQWQSISATVLAALADDRWLRSQLERPRYDDVPR